MLECFECCRDINTEYSIIEEYKLFLIKEKTLYSYLNLMKIEPNHISGYCWIPKDSEEEVMSNL